MENVLVAVGGVGLKDGEWISCSRRSGSNRLRMDELLDEKWE